MIFACAAAMTTAGVAEASSVASGGTHSCAIASSGDVRCWGSNTYGQLGDGTTTSRTRPVLVSAAAGATQLAAGAEHTCALIGGGTVMCWGRGTSGQLGNGGTASSGSPVSVSGVTNAVQVAVGTSHTCALLADLTVKCWGANASGQIGDGTTTQRPAPTAVGSLAGVTALAAGANHNCAVTGGAVKCWGLGASGQLGDGGTANAGTPVTAAGLTGASGVTAGDNHTCAIATGGSARCWGLNADGQLGDGTTTQRNSPVFVSGGGVFTTVEAGGTHTCGAQSTPQIVCWGRGASGELGTGASSQSLTPAPAQGVTEAVSLSSGGQHTCAVNASGPTQCWGENGASQLGDGATTDRNSPVSVQRLNGAVAVAAGSAHTCVSRVVGTVACFGDNTYGQVGDGTTTTSANAYPATVSGMTGVTAVGLGQWHSCAVDAGQAKCWGRNGGGQLGNNSTSQQVLPVNASGFSTASIVSGGNQHSCGFAASGQAKCWGANGSGQLGDGSTSQRLVPTDLSALTNAIDISAGGTFGCAVASGGQAKCWGLGMQGQLGNGAASDSSSPVNVSGVAGAKAVGAGYQHACAALTDGTGRCWGSNSNGQLGDNSTSQRNSPVAVSGLSGAVVLDGGDYHTCAAIDDGSVSCWGANNRGQLGDGGASGAESHVPVSVSGLSDAVAVALGAQHTCAVTGAGETYCWGYNLKGQLGNASTADQSLPSLSDLMEPLVKVSAPAEGAITGDTTPTVEFTLAESSVAFTECSVDGGAWVSCSSPSWTVPSTLSLGTHWVSVRTTDQNNNIGITNRSFSVGTPPPTVSITAPAAGAYVGDATPSVSFSATGSAPLTAECRVDGGSWAGCNSPYTTASLTDASHTVEVRVTDSFSNTASDSVSFTVDTALPIVAATAPTDNTVTTDTTPTLSFTVTDASPLTVECRTDSGAWSACASPHTFATLSEGAHSLNVRATDAAGNVGSDGVPITIDTTLPAVAISSPTAGAFVNDSTPDVAFTVTDATTTTVRCRVDSGSWSTGCASPYTPSTLTDGSHTVEVEATDQAGNVGTATRTFTVDTALPAVGSFSPGDGSFTSDTTPSFSFGVTDANATTTQCSVDGGSYGSCSSPFTAPLLTGGGHTLAVRATDAANNIGNASVSFTVDAVLPVVAISSPTAGAFVNDSTPDVAFTVTDATTTTVRCRVDSGSWSTGCVSPYTPSTLTDGSHTVEVEATDQAGNVGMATRTFTVDTALPVVGSFSPGDGSFTSDTTPSFSFGVTDANATTTQCSVDGGSYGSCSSPFTTPLLTGGGHTLAVRATDAANNIGNASISFTVDAVLPVVAISSPTAGAFVNDSTPDVAFTVTDATTTTVRCRVDSGSWSTGCASPYTPSTLTDGSHTVEVEATDQAGNVGTATRSFTVDTTAPVLSIVSPGAGSTTGDDTPDVTFTSSDTTALTIECRVDGGSYGGCASPFTTPTLADGPHTVYVRATDQVGLQTNRSVAFTVDSSLPVVDITQPVEGAAITDSSPDVVFTATDGGPLTVECREDAGAWAGCSSPYTTSALAQGAHTVTVRATDLSSNAVSETVSFTVDSNPPAVTIDSPVDFSTVNDATPDIAFTVTDITATTDECNVDGNGWVGCSSPFTTSSLSDGAHFVAVRSTDAAGSIGSTIVSFTVDANPPVVNISSPAGGSATADNTPDVAFTATDASAVTTECRVDGGAFGSCGSPFTAPTLADGQHTVYVRATDATVSQTTASVTFYVDTAVPVVSIASPTASQLTGDNTPALDFSVTDLTATATECRVDTGSWVSCSSGWTPSPLADGSRTLSVRAVDAAGNTGTASVTFTVDASDPVVAIGSPAGGSALSDSTPAASFTVTDSSSTTEQCRVDSGSWSPCTSPYTAPLQLDGSHTLHVQSTDQAGNTGSTSVTVTVDTTAPVTAISAPLGGSTIADPTPDVSFTNTDLTVVTTQCRADGGSFTSCSSPWTAPSLADGSHTVQVQATDAAGNSATVGVTFNIDTTLPVVGISAPSPGTTTTDNTPSVAFTASGLPVLTTECRVDSGSFTACGSPWTPPALTDGSHTLTVRATDGLARTATASVSVTVDTVAPVTAISAPANGGAVASSTPTASFSATDTGAVTVVCSVDAGPFNACSSPAVLPSLAEGPHALQVRATDAAGNQTTATSSFEVDLTTPVVTISSPAVGATLATATPSIAFSATDATALTYACSVDSGAYTSCVSPYTTPALTNASHTVSVRATDAAGNQATGSVSFTVAAATPSPPPGTTPAPVDSLPTAANLRAKRSGRKIGLTFKVFHPASSTLSCDSPVLVKAKFSSKLLKLRRSMSGLGPVCQLSITVTVPRGAKGRASITAVYFGNAYTDEVDADTSVRVK